MGAGFGWNQTASSSTMVGGNTSVPAGRVGALYFAPYYNYTRGTLTRTSLQLVGPNIIDTFYNQSAKSPKKLSNGFADGLLYLVLN